MWTSLLDQEDWGLKSSRTGIGLILLSNKHIWDLFIDAGSLWVAWVHTYLLQGKNFWYVHIPNSCSWGWRKILKFRDMIKPSFSHSNGKGVRTVLCHGNWNSKGASFPKFVFRLVFEAVYSFDAKVSSTLQEDNLIYPRDGDKLFWHPLCTPKHS